VSSVDVAAAVLWVGVIAYSVFGGADFGAGFWDLVAGDADDGEGPRALIDRAIGPVWEANHVWLIFCLVMLWTGFPPAFTAVMTTLSVPLSLAAFGVVLRGAGFAFRKVTVAASGRRAYGAVFAFSSLLTPFSMGMVAGGIASGRVPLRSAPSARWSSWLNPTSLLGGVLAVAVCAYLAAVLLVGDARRFDEEQLVEYFTRRALGSGIVTGVAAFVGVFVLAVDAPTLYHRLLGRALPLVVASGLCGAATLYCVARRQHRLATPARALAALAVASVVAAWGVAQYPNILIGSLTLEAAAAPSITLKWLIGIAAVAVAILVPSFALLYSLDQRNLLDDTPAR
jgi:cytochrome d ubiquinol oxidase subunit II